MAETDKQEQEESKAKTARVKGRRVDTANLNLKRTPVRPREDNEPPPSNGSPVSAGPVDRVIELAFNPTRDKIREVTIIDRMQGRLFPIMDTVDALFLDCVKIAAYRQSPEVYEEVFKEKEPAPMADIMGELLYRTAQWQKSVAGKNLERATDIALAEMEAREPMEDDPLGSKRGYED